MKKKILIAILGLFIIISIQKICLGNENDYKVYNSWEYNSNQTDENTKILFIIDFSNSMNDTMHGERKIDIAVNTLASITSKLSSDAYTGLRVYGHKFGFNNLIGCRASELVNSIKKNNSANIYNSLRKIQASGWTPITYSLKQAVNNDFYGLTGKKHIILLTDGGENCDESPCEYAIKLVQQRDDIKIDVIAFALDDDLANAQLKCTALVTSGKLYEADNAESLSNSLEDALNVTTEVQGTIIKK